MGASVVVVGASNPTGFAIVQAFLAQGASVEVLVRTPEQGELIGLKLGAPPHLSCRTVDFTDSEDCELADRAILAERGPDRRVFAIAAGPVPSEVGAESVRLASDAGVDSARILMPGAFVGDPSWEQLIAARLGLNTRLAQHAGNAGPS